MDKRKQKRNIKELKFVLSKNHPPHITNSNIYLGLTLKQDVVLKSTNQEVKVPLLTFI